MQLKQILWAITLLGNLSFAAESLPPAIPLPPLPTPTPATVGGLSFSRGITLAEFSRIVLEDILKKPFVLPPELISASQLVGVSTSKLSPSTAESVLSKVLKSQGFELVPGPVYYVNKTIPPKDVSAKQLDWISYKPKNRQTSYFASTLPNVFPDVKFSFDKQAKGSPGSGDQAGLDLFFAYVDVNQKKQLESVIAELDIPVPRVSLRALLVEVSSDDRKGSGIKLVASALAGRIGLSIDGGSTGHSFSISTKNGVDAVLSAFDGDTRFKTVSFPALQVFHAQTGRLQVATKIPYQTTTTADGVTKTSTEFQDVGTTVNLVPEVLGDTVSVSVKLELSDVASTSLGSGSASTVLTRNFSTQTSLKSGQAVLLGNIDSSRDTSNKSSLFGFNLSSERSVNSSELVLMLYAEILP